MIDPVFARNPKEAERLSEKHLAIIGCGSGGSALALMAARSGVGRFTLTDPDDLALENVGRHILSRGDVGKPKVLGIKRLIEDVNPAAHVEAICGKFEDLARKPDLIVAATDSFACESAINDCSLREKVPAVYGGCWGEASVGEILYVVPGRTPCYECYAGFRRDTAEIPSDPRKYTDPDFDSTKVPGQAGLWANILIITGVMFQVVLGLLDPESDRAQLIDYEHTLFLVNVSNYAANLQPLAVTFGKVRKGCAICEESHLAELGKDLQFGPPISR
jgi:molybdopterin/thiamine biosynthesis adenylyltransferase